MAETRWSRVAVVYGAGVVAATALGKVAPAGPLLQRELGLSLAQLGWAVSAITAVAALLGAPAGAWTRRRGARLALLVGLVLMAAAGAAGAAAPAVGAMLASRVAEGAGYLLVVVAGPSLIVRLAAGRGQPIALALWGTFVPVGLAASAALGGALAPVLGWRGWFGLASVLPVLVALVVAAAVPADDARAVVAAPRLRGGGLQGPLLLAGAFCGIALIGVAVLGLLPTFLVERRTASVAAAGAVTAAASLASVPGSLLAGWLLRRGTGLRRLAAAGLLMPAAALVAFSEQSPPAAAFAAAAMILLANGALVGGMYAAVPRLVQDVGDVDLANGLLVQLGSLGTLVGPPLLSLAVAAAGWDAVAVVVLAVTVAAVGLLSAAAAHGHRRIAGGG